MKLTILSFKMYLNLDLSGIQRSYFIPKYINLINLDRKTLKQ